MSYPLSIKHYMTVEAISNGESSHARLNVVRSRTNAMPSHGSRAFVREWLLGQTYASSACVQLSPFPTRSIS
jgi:hypothetical protein